MKRCGACSSLMPDDAATCIKCGTEAVRQSAPVPRPAAGMARPAAAQVPKPGKISGGWALARQSWRVLMLDKELLVFPVISGIACLLLMASFAAGIFATGMITVGAGAHKVTEGAASNAAWLVLFVYYVANYFVIVYFNSALVACAMIRFRGGDPTLRDGLLAANARIAQIALWALLAATVGVVLRVIQERVQLVGKVITGLLGAAWTVATYFVVPVLVVEKVGPVDAFQRSALLMKQTWGESLVSNVGIGIVSIVATIVILVAGGALTLTLWNATGAIAALAIGIAAVVAGMLIVFLVTSALNTIVLAALYLYAAEQKVPEAFDGIVQEAFAAR